MEFSSIEPDDNTTSWLMSHMPIFPYINIRPVSQMGKLLLADYFLFFLYYTVTECGGCLNTV